MADRDDLRVSGAPTGVLCGRCGHDQALHWQGLMCNWFAQPDSRWIDCDCTGFAHPAALPATGERPVFGVHRLSGADTRLTEEER